MSRIHVDGEHLTLAQLFAVALHSAETELALAARARMVASRAVVERLVESNSTVYGVNTGFGKMASARISREQIEQLQLNLVRSHACGTRNTRHAAAASECHCQGIFGRAPGGC
jgi:histidine ammonia-lyase